LLGQTIFNHDKDGSPKGHCGRKNFGIKFKTLFFYDRFDILLAMRFSGVDEQIKIGNRGYMKMADDIIKIIVNRFRSQGYSQVEGYNRFDFVRESSNSVIIRRESGGEPEIPYSKIRKAIEVVRSDPAVYEKGPGSLQKYGITHVSSPIWSLLHLLSLNELTGK
jgi:hypothetical protein